MIPLVTGTIGLVVAAIIILLIRKDRLHVRHGLGWITVAAAFAILGFSPEIIDSIAQHLGINYPPVLGLTIGISLVVLKILLMDIECSRAQVHNQRLIQRVAMLEADLRKCRNVAEVETNAPQA